MDARGARPTKAAFEIEKGARQVTTGGVELSSLQPLGGGLIYSYNVIEAFAGANAGLVTWECDSTIKGNGTVVGANVVFASGAKVVTMSH